MSQPQDDLSARNYRAFVGPEQGYDLMGASQFRLLTTLGLRATHRVLDLGCGSLRAGRLLIPWLNQGNYHGIEPNAWLIDQVIEQELGQDLIRLKQPRFDHNEHFDTQVFETSFDLILAQSIFSHAGTDLLDTALASISQSLTPSGLLAATFLNGVDMNLSGWLYPKCMTYEAQTLRAMAAGHGLSAMPIPWYHPRQTWWLIARSEEQLPKADQLIHLGGGTLREPSLKASLGGMAGLRKALSRWYKHRLLARFRGQRSDQQGI